MLRQRRATLRPPVTSKPPAPPPPPIDWARMRVAAVALGRGVAFDGDRDRVRLAAGAARTADADIDSARAGAGERDVAGDVEPAGAAAAGERLGDDAARAIAHGRRCDQILIDGAAGDGLVDVGHDRAGNAAGSAGAANADADIARARAGQSDSRGDVEGARAAAAADRLREDRVAVVAFGDARFRARRD